MSSSIEREIRGPSTADSCSRLSEQYAAGGLGDGRLSVYLLSDRIGALHRGPRADRLEPALEVRKVLELLTLPLVGHDPGIACHVGDGIGPGDEFAIGEPLVEHRIETVCLLDVAVDRVGDILQ